jgi:hypothetical protein
MPSRLWCRPDEERRRGTPPIMPGPESAIPNVRIMSDTTARQPLRGDAVVDVVAQVKRLREQLPPSGGHVSNA